MAAWGEITGTLTSQSDLNAALRGLSSLQLLAYNNANGTTMSGNTTNTIVYDTIQYQISGGGYSFDNGELTIPAVGTYLIRNIVQVQGTATNTGIGAHCFWETDDGGGFAAVPGTTHYLTETGKSGTASLHNAGASCMGIITTTGTNKKLRVRCFVWIGMNPIFTANKSCILQIYRIRTA